MGQNLFLGLALGNYHVIGQKFEVGVAFPALPLVLKLSSSGWFLEEQLDEAVRA